jgi:hypothetical protein
MAKVMLMRCMWAIYVPAGVMIMSSELTSNLDVVFLF